MELITRKHCYVVPVESVAELLQLCQDAAGPFCYRSIHITKDSVRIATAVIHSVGNIETIHALTVLKNLGSVKHGYQ